MVKSDFDWAVVEAAKKKKLDLAEFLTMDEGLCVQIMHIGLFAPRKLVFQTNL